MTQRTDSMLAHNVFFTLKEPSDVACQALVDDCHTYLKDHPGVVFFAAGVRDEELQRPVNDFSFHVGLHVIFDNRQSHDTYQEAAQHLEFIEKNRDSWQQVRVFDSLVN